MRNTLKVKTKYSNDGPDELPEMECLFICSDICRFRWICLPGVQLESFPHHYHILKVIPDTFHPAIF
jgi:hypothetical protein